MPNIQKYSINNRLLSISLFFAPNSTSGKYGDGRVKTHLGYRPLTPAGLPSDLDHINR